MFLFRGLLSTAALIVLGVGGAVYYVYGEVEPCRVLAAEYAFRAEKEGSLLGVLGVDLAKMYRAETSQYSMGECSGKLIDSWVERLSGTPLST